MLNRFRNAMRGVVAWIIGILIILAMAVVGVPALDNFGGRAAIEVGSRDISARDLELELRQQIQRIQLENPNVTREQILAAGVAEQTIEQLVTRALLENEAARLGLVAPDSVVQTYIRNIEGLTDPETGRFDQQRLGFFLQQQGLSLTGFRDLVAADLMRSQLVEALTVGATVPDEYARLILLREFEQRTVDLATLPVSEETLAVTDEEVQAAYEANLQDYQSPEYRAFTVLTISADDLAEDIEITEDEVRQLYEARQGAAAARETRSVRQLNVSGDAAERAAALAGEGADLDAIAEEVGGSVTTLEGQTRDDFINDALAEAVFAAEEGATVGPIETPFGDVFAEVTEVNRTEGESFEEKREALRNELRAEIADDRLLDIVENVEIARDEGASLAEAAQSAGLSVRTTGLVDDELFTRTGSIANVPRVLAAEGFRLEEGLESRAVNLEDGYGFIAVDEVVEPEPLPLDEVRDAVEARVRAEKQANIASELEEQFQNALVEGTDFAAAAQALGGSASQQTISARQENEGIPAPVTGLAFNLPVGGLDAAAAGDGSSVYVVRVAGASYPDPAQIEAIVPVIGQQFSQQVAGELTDAYRLALRRTTEVRQSPSQIARATGRDVE